MGLPLSVFELLPFLWTGSDPFITYNCLKYKDTDMAKSKFIGDRKWRHHIPSCFLPLDLSPTLVLLSPKIIFAFPSYRPLSEREVILLSLNTVLVFPSGLGNLYFIRKRLATHENKYANRKWRHHNFNFVESRNDWYCWNCLEETFSKYIGKWD